MYIKDDGHAKRPRTTPGAPPGGPGAFGAPPQFAGYAPPAHAAPFRDEYRSGGGYAPGNATADNPPCNTLFVGNLGDNVNEQELRAVFQGAPVGLGSRV